MRITPTYVRPRTGATGTALTGMVLCFLLLVGLAGAAAAPDRVVLRTPLGAGLDGEIRADGSLVLRAAQASEPALVAGIHVHSPRRQAVGTDGRSHVGRATEGCEDGQRGLSERADDDGDGRLDEDPLDGRDNDGDGRIDEDYAAIGDVMLAVDRGAGAGRVEFYRWAYPHLQSIVFAAPTAGIDAVGPATWKLETAGTDWIETDVRGLRHQVTGRAEDLTTHVYVTWLPAAVTGAAPAWLGVAVLDEPDHDGVGRTILDGRELDIRLGAPPVPVALGAADSWLALVRLLTEARAVRAGVTDPVSGDHVPWVVPARCGACRTAVLPDFHWRLNRQGHLTLSAEITAETGAQIDPDRFRVGGRDLGAPDQILWRAAGDEETGLGWYAMEPGRLARTGIGLADPYLGLTALAEHGAEGTLSFRFRTPPTAVVDELSGDGGQRPAAVLQAAFVGTPHREAALAPDLTETDAMRSAVSFALAGDPQDAIAPTAGDQARLLRNDGARPTLAPTLLSGWPNPFRHVINLRFQIPQTVGEAFVWDGDAGTPQGVVAHAPVPWSGGEPQVTVKIYSISGRELKTLHEGSELSGEVTVHWDGTDSFGRKVASGTYFCKLQMDDWSTTRRLVFVR